MGCLFCKIVAREIPSHIVLETDHALCFRDVRPVAPTHFLVVPKQHITGVAEAGGDEGPLLGELLLAARDAAKQEGLTNGYRLVINSGPDAGQSVFHVHVHVLGGRALAWPPG